MPAAAPASPRIWTTEGLAPALTVLAALATGAALAVAGPAMALLPATAVAVVLLAARPRVLLLLYAVAIVVFEDDELGFLPQRSAFYDGVPAPADVIFAVLTLATLAWVVQQRRALRMPEPFTRALILVGFAVAAGAVLGWMSAGDRMEIVNTLRTFAPLLTVPVLVVNLVDDERLLVGAAAGGAALAGIKGVEGIAAWATGGGRPLEGTTITFYEPATNFLLLVFVCGVVAALLLRVRMPPWVVAALPVATAAFVLSYRRNFWIAGLLALALLFLLTRLQRDRRMLLPFGALVVVAITATLAWQGPPELEGPVAQRFTSLAPNRIATNPYDRYRLDEQQNVVAELRRSPLLGLGLGVPWEVTHPLPVELEGGRLYTHTVALWYWLKLGLAGLAAYVWLMLAAVATSLRIARHSGNGVVRATALELGVGMLGMVVAETSGSFTGVSGRYSILVAFGLGWLAAAQRLLRRPDPE